MINLSDHSAYTLINIINIYSDVTEGGVDNAQISASHVTGQSSDLHIGGEFFSESFSTSTSSSSEPSGGRRRSVNIRSTERPGGRGESGVNHPLGSHTVHTLYTQSVQTVHQDKFSHKTLSADY